MGPLYVFVIFCKNAKDIRVMGRIDEKGLTAAGIHTTIFAKHFYIGRYLRNCLIEVPIVASKGSHHAIAFSGGIDLVPVDSFENSSHFSWSSLTPSVLCSVVFAARCP